MVEGNLSL